MRAGRVVRSISLGVVDYRLDFRRAACWRFFRNRVAVVILLKKYITPEVVRRRRVLFVSGTIIEYLEDRLNCVIVIPIAEAVHGEHVRIDLLQYLFRGALR